MKILHYIIGLPPVRTGGLVKYALDLVEDQIEQNHQVSIMIPGKFTIFNKNTTKIKLKKWNNISCYNIINPLPVSGGKGFNDVENFCKSGEVFVFYEFLSKIKPDIIHVHSFMGLHASFLEAAKQLEIPIVYTTHDYFGLCPNTTLIKGMENCCETEWKNCSQCMNSILSLKKIWWEHSDLFMMIKRNRLFQIVEYSQKMLPVKNFIKKQIRKVKPIKNSSEGNKCCMRSDYVMLQDYYKEMFSYISYYHFNSNQAKEVYTSKLGLLNGKVLYITNKNICDNRRYRDYNNTLRISYIASTQGFKGFPILKETLDDIYKEGLKDFVCNVYCNLKDIDIPYIRRHKPYKSSEIQQVYDNTDVLIMPSIWKETFGLVALEALSYGVPIIITQNVGMKDIFNDKQNLGIITKADKESIKEEIIKIYNNRDILKQMNKNICEWKNDFSFEKHVGEVVGMYKDIIQKMQGVI